MEYAIEYAVCAYIDNNPAGYILGIYKSEENAITRRNMGIEKVRQLNLVNIKIRIEPIKVYEQHN